MIKHTKDVLADYKYNKPQTLNQLNWIYDKFDDVIDMLDEKSLIELSGGYDSDLDELLNNMKKFILKSFRGVPEEVQNNQFYSLTNLTTNIHETLKIINYNYFKLTMLPDFHVSPHSAEWGNIVQLYPRTCILASRRLGKTYDFSNALPIWKLYGYRKPSLMNPIDKKTALRRQGLIITNSYALGKKILSDISKEIKNNNALHEVLKPENKNEGSLGKEYIETKNGGEIHLRSASSSSRGLHPGWVIVDDYGDNNWIYSEEQRQKAIDFFYADIMKTLERGSTINIVGCVHPNTTVITKDGLRKIGDLCPVGSYKEKGLYELEIDVLGKNGWNKTSHYWCNGLTNTKKITLKSGYDLECSLIHPLWKMNENGVPEWCEAQNLKVGDNVGVKPNLDSDLIYLPIEKIEDSKAYTVDFHIPEEHNFITNGIVSHNTPFFSTDLYAHIRENDHTFKYFEYPAVMPDGTVTAPHRWNMEELQKEYETNGPIIFSREILVVPLSDNSTIFPWEMLSKAFVGMQDYRLVQNRDSFPIKFKFVSVGCDFARSANIGSDSTVFTVWGIDTLENFWLLHIWRKSGAGYNEQIAKLKEIERNFRPDEIIAESNGFQQIMAEIGRDHGIKNITDFNTTGFNKKDLYEGLPSLAILFNQGRIKMPRGDVYSKEMTDLICTEFNSITIKPDSGKLESGGAKDDIVMSTWFAIKCISVNKKKDINFIMI